MTHAAPENPDTESGEAAPVDPDKQLNEAAAAAAGNSSLLSDIAKAGVDPCLLYTSDAADE